MAPAPAAATSPSPTSTTSATPTSSSTPKTFGTASIVAIVIFAVFALIAIASLALFYINRRRHHASLPPNMRPTSTYRPYRTSSTKSSASKGLLADAAAPEADDKASMFSRDRAGSTATLSLYVPEEHDYDSVRVSVGNTLVPIVVSPADDAEEIEMRGQGRVKPLSLRVEEELDLGVARSRPRSASTASTRYYDGAVALPPPVPALPPSY